MRRPLQPECAGRQARRDVELEAFVFRNDGSRPLVKVSNISYRGCEIAEGPDFEPSERVTLVLPDRGETGALIRWSAQGRAGASFERDGRTPDTKPIFARPYYFGSGRVFGKRAPDRAFG